MYIQQLAICFHEHLVGTQQERVLQPPGGISSWFCIYFGSHCWDCSVIKFHYYDQYSSLASCSFHVTPCQIITACGVYSGHVFASTEPLYFFSSERFSRTYTNRSSIICNHMCLRSIHTDQHELQLNVYLFTHFYKPSTSICDCMRFRSIRTARLAAKRVPENS